MDWLLSKSKPPYSLTALPSANPSVKRGTHENLILLGQWLIINYQPRVKSISEVHSLQLLVLSVTSFSIKSVFGINRICAIMVDSQPHLPMSDQELFTRTLP